MVLYWQFYRWYFIWSLRIIFSTEVSLLLRWYKFGEGGKRQPVPLDERVKQLGGTLIIREARVDDSGKYLCVVNNSVGGESVETVLTVTGKT